MKLYGILIIILFQLSTGFQLKYTSWVSPKSKRNMTMKMEMKVVKIPLQSNPSLYEVQLHNILHDVDIIRWSITKVISNHAIIEAVIQDKKNKIK